jgi:uncharacterized membrane protein YfcA
MSKGIVGLVVALGAVAITYIALWYRLERARFGGTAAASRAQTHRRNRGAVVRASCMERGRWRARPPVVDLIIGFITNFFDALGIGNFAPTTAAFKFLRRMPDEQIPGTLNAGHALPVIAEAIIFIGAVSVDLMTLVGMITAAVAGAWLGAGIAARLPRRIIQAAIGVALIIAALLFIAKNLGWLPAGGASLGLRGGWLVLAIGVSLILGSLMMIGVGFYAPCLILVSLLGMNPLASFPIMMGACAFLMPVGAVRFIRVGRYDLFAALGLTLGGIPGVLIAAFIVKSLPLTWLRWLVVVVVFYAGAVILFSARRGIPNTGPAGARTLSNFEGTRQ